MSLRKSLAAMLLVAILPVAAMLAWQVWHDLGAERQRMQDELAHGASAFAGSIDRELASSIDALTVLSQSEIFQQGRIAAMGRLLQGRPRRDWDSIFLLDANGAVVLDTAPHGPSLPRDALRELHARALQARGPVVSGVTANPGVAIALPIMQAGHVRYVLGVRTSDAVWTRLALNASRPEDGIAQCFDAERHLIAQSASAVQHTSGENDDELYAAWATVPLSGWKARVAVPAAPIDAARRQAIITALSTSGLSLFAGLVLAALVGARIARTYVPARDAGKDAQDSRAFLEKLSHEVRNPIGAITAAADVLQTAEPGSEVDREARDIVSRQSRTLATRMYDMLRARMDELKGR